MAQEMHIRITVSRTALLWMMVAVILSTGPAPIGSETVTLETYYPAPYGIYTQLRSTSKTTLGEGITGSDYVGIGTASPGAKLDVQGTGGVILNAGAVGVGGTADAAYDFDVKASMPRGGVVHAAKYIKVDGTGCTMMNNVPAGTACGANQYATYAPGLFVVGQWYQQRPDPFFFVYGASTKLYAAAALGTGVGIKLPVKAWDNFDYGYVELIFDSDSGISFYCCNL